MPPRLRGGLVGLLVASIALTVLESGAESAELGAVVDVLRPLLGAALAAVFAVATYGAAQIGRKPVEGR